MPCSCNLCCCVFCLLLVQMQGRLVPAGAPCCACACLSAAASAHACSQKWRMLGAADAAPHLPVQGYRLGGCHVNAAARRMLWGPGHLQSSTRDGCHEKKTPGASGLGCDTPAPQQLGPASTSPHSAFCVLMCTQTNTHEQCLGAPEYSTQHFMPATSNPDEFTPPHFSFNK
jgi:hypothetical protein